MKTIVALYDDLNEARRVVEDLVNNGVDREDISLMAGDPQGTYADELATPESEVNEAADGAAVGAVGGAVVGGLGGILLGLGALAIPGLGPVIAAGPIVAGLVGAGIGAAAGGLVGALVGWGVPEEEAVYYTEGVRRGATLVSVRSPDMMVERVSEIMDRHQPVNIQERAESWRQTGWTGSGEQQYAATGAGASESSPTGMGMGTTRTGGAVDVDTGTGMRTGAQATATGSAMGAGYTGSSTASGTDYSGGAMGSSGSGSTQGTTATGSFIGDSRSGSGMAVSEGGTSMDAMAADSGTGAHESGRTATTGMAGSPIGATGTGSALGTHDAESSDISGDYEAHYNQTYAHTGRPYRDYKAAYHYGYLLCLDDRYQGRNWDEVESDARNYWGSRYQDVGPWEDFKEAVRHAWNSMSGGSSTGYDEDEDYYRQHYNTSYAHTGRDFSYYEPAYTYGSSAATDERYYGRDWDEVEPELRQRWETDYRDKGAWDEFKDGVRHAWDSLTDAFDVDYDEDYYRDHYSTTYATSGRDFSYYDPAYRFGHNAAMDERYYDRDWDEVEPELRQRWTSEYQGQGLWEDVKDGVRHAWDSVNDLFEDDYDEDYYRNHYNSYFANTGRSFDYYDPAYRYGYNAAMDDRYYARDWDEIEPELRQRWTSEYHGQGVWDDIKDAVRHSWESITDAVVPSYDEDYYRRHYHSYFSSTGRDYDYYEPAYRYGYSAAADDRYYGRDWDEVEPELRQRWETEYGGQGAWEDFKDAVRHAWSSVTDTFEPDYDEDYYRNHYNTTYATSGRDFDYYEPAYYYGYTIASTPDYSGRDWNEIEPEVRRQWETEHHDKGAWDEFKDAISHAWKHVTGQPHTHY